MKLQNFNQYISLIPKKSRIKEYLNIFFYKKYSKKLEDKFNFYNIDKLHKNELILN